ncbi:MAG TPA: hypothetical protein VHC43_02985 [Mycobacteriales bacterium]|nr:hypothetical protein [Mycobacteriales bacterium]
MKRTTKAMARLATLAVIAGGALSAPFAIGTANATVTGVTVANGTIGSNEDASAASYYPHAATVTWSPSHANSTISLAGTGAYFPATANQALGGGNVNVTGATTATCAATGAGACTAVVGDSVAESVTAFIVDPVDATSASATVGFNGIFITGCPQSGIDTGTAPNVAYGNPAQNTSQNCVTQGQFGQPLLVSAKYLAGGAGVIQGTEVLLTSVNEKPGPNTSTCTEIDNTHIDCTSDASGNFSFNLINNGVGTPPAPEADTYQITTRNSTGTYPGIVAAPPAGAAPTEQVNWGVGGVTPVRVNLISSIVLAPDSANASGQQPAAEPGDAVKNVYQIEGSCTPVSPAVTCDGTRLAGVSVPVTVDKGFITPNCTQGGVTSYAECSFATTPTVGAQAGNLTNSGTSATVSTNVAGRVTVTYGIGRDSGFDQQGVVPTHVTIATIGVTGTGNRTTGANQTCGQGLAGTQSDVYLPTISGLLALYNDNADCPQDFEWTTAEAPLNGGTAKLVAIPAIAQPNNTAIQTENNSAATDSGTTNVPDVNRVDFVIHETDQFGNLTSGTLTAALAAASHTPSLTKTGPGWLFSCTTGFSSTSACTTPTGSGSANTTNADGTTTQVVNGTIGSYLANVNDGAPGAVLFNGQFRYQVDTTGAGLGNQGYPCSTAFATCFPGLVASTPGVNDGTTTVVESWAAPTTTFATYHAGTPTIATFSAGTGTAATDTFTLNFYNQLAQPVVTFVVKPGSSVATGTAVTVQATVVDQNGNPIVNQVVDAIRSGANEATCVPAQTQGNGGNVTTPLATNTSGVAGYTFTCNGAGVSNVSMVVLGPGGTQLAQGREAITFNGPAVGGGQKVEKPTVAILAPKRHVLAIHVVTHPSLHHVTVHFYKVVNGLRILIGAAKTGPAGHAHLRVEGLRSGTHHRYTAKVVNLSSKYKSEYAKSHKHRVR